MNTCKECGEEFILQPVKPGFANVCPRCTEPPEALAKRAQAEVALQEATKAATSANKRNRRKTEREKTELDLLRYKAVRYLREKGIQD